MRSSTTASVVDSRSRPRRADRARRRNDGVAGRTEGPLTGFRQPLLQRCARFRRNGGRSLGSDSFSRREGGLRGPLRRPPSDCPRPRARGRRRPSPRRRTPALCRQGRLRFLQVALLFARIDRRLQRVSRVYPRVPRPSGGRARLLLRCRVPSRGPTTGPRGGCTSSVRSFAQAQPAASRSDRA